MCKAFNLAFLLKVSIVGCDRYSTAVDYCLTRSINKPYLFDDHVASELQELEKGGAVQMKSQVFKAKNVSIDLRHSIKVSPS